MRDLHVHSNYSDGDFLFAMVRAADEAGLEGIGIADHCIVSDRDTLQRSRDLFGFSLDRTYDRRRQAIERLRASMSVDVYDAVEMDYHPDDESDIEAFLSEADFDYVVGSVHEVDGRNVQASSQFRDESDADLDRIVDTYVDRLVSLIESGLFDVAAHVDLVERTEPLRGRLSDEHYERVAAALADSRTVPEINAGRALREEALVHPRDPFLEVLLEHDVPVTLGSDAHAPEEVLDRAAFLDAFVEKHDIEPVVPSDLGSE